MLSPKDLDDLEAYLRSYCADNGVDLSGDNDIIPRAQAEFIDFEDKIMNGTGSSEPLGILSSVSKA